MSEQTRRDFLRDSATLGALVAWSGLAPDLCRAADDAVVIAEPVARLGWLGGRPPLLPVEVSWGVPWPRGAMPKDAQVVVRAGNGSVLPTQHRPLAFWPDGSLKWSGLAIAADAQTVLPLSAGVGTTTAPAAPLGVRDAGGEIEIASGGFSCRIVRGGPAIIASIAIDGREVGRDGRLVAVREDRSRLADQGVTREERFVSRVASVTVEQAGPVRAVVRIDGVHAAVGGQRSWLPFTVRLYATAGVPSLRLVHSFVYDGDEQVDFIRGLGISFTVPFREERQNRHLRFACDGDGVWAEPVLMSPGYRPQLVKNAVAMNKAQLEGRRIPNLSELAPETKAQFETVAVWDAFKLSQLAPDSFAIDKRTGTASSWLHAMNGQRARGCAFVGDVSGGLAVGVKRFWEKYPAAIEVVGAAGAEATLTAWLWSPDAPAMDLRHYDVVGHDGKISYEDYQPGFSTPNGVANTNELTLWAMAATPERAAMVAMATTANEPPLLICDPEQYHDTGVLGVWSLVDRSTPERAVIEEQLERAWRFYAGEVERRRWYGFWDFGDFMRTYDSLRHGWLYDIGGHAWNNSELVPNAWLWFTFLRTGRADAFRLAEAMTRNTSEVDVYHAGRFAGLGSRHNVNHWGCGAKEARISEAWLTRFYYYLTGDERTGDLMREVLTVDRTLMEVPPLREVLPRSDVKGIIRIGPDWLAMASNWLTEWERTGNPRYRDYLLAGMTSIGAMPAAFTTRLAFRYDPESHQLFDIGEPNLPAGEFLDLFGGDQIAMELMQLVDCPEFARAWDLLCGKWAHAAKPPGYTVMRIAAYAARRTSDAALASRAWNLLKESMVVNGGERFPLAPVVLAGPQVAAPVAEIPAVSSFGTVLATPETAQWAINALTTMELIRTIPANGVK